MKRKIIAELIRCFFEVALLLLCIFLCICVLVLSDSVIEYVSAMLLSLSTFYLSFYTYFSIRDVIKEIRRKKKEKANEK